MYSVNGNTGIWYNEHEDRAFLHHNLKNLFFSVNKLNIIIIYKYYDKNNMNIIEFNI